MTGRLAAAAMRGSLWLAAINLVSKGSQVAVTLTLAAHLAEADLGAVTLVVAVVNIAQVVQAAGVYDVISRTTRDPLRMAGTVLTLSVGAGVALAGALALAAPTVAAVLGAPDAAPLIRLAALTLPFTAAGGVQMGLMHRDLDFRRRLLPDAGSAVLGAAVTIALAAGGGGAVSLVVGLLCAAVAQPLLGLVAGARVRPRWDTGAAGEALRWIAVVGPAAIVATLLINLDYPVIGHVLGPDAVGVYSLAYRIAWMPYIIGAIVLGAVAFPVYTRLIRTGRRADLPAAVSRFTRAVAVVTGGLYLVAAVLSDRVVLLGERWAPSAGVLVLLCGYGLAISVAHLWHEAIRAAGHPRLYLALLLTHLGLLVVALALLTRHGVLAVAAGQAAVAALLLALTWLTLVRLGLAPAPRELAGIAVGVLGAAALAALPVIALDRAGFFGSPRSLAGSAAAAAVLLLAYVLGTLLIQRGAIGELRPARVRAETFGEQR
ncbi:oligosaccharide flippase family protein [Actinokineospora iranica]|uniref:Polysaccharide transporter, PST family n=1 Tax=Actinokineospora iranica TaxID=1271860 RepID=A0A1G6XCY2_9PSEU|nr:oligosaccharide flippase family protein [Actinokineospora iranica]SDD75931.1 polysaccharide transporter, PST family [Actinokineospora iranica]